jgi:hypothetical protein
MVPCAHRPSNIVSRKGVNDITFGMLRSDVRKWIGAPVEVFKRTETSFPADIYASSVFFYYDKDDRLEAVEFADGIELRVNGHLVSGLAFQELRALILTWDPTALDEVDEVRSDALGIATNQGDKIEEGVTYEALIAYRDGYWAEYDAKWRTQAIPGTSDIDPRTT